MTNRMKAQSVKTGQSLVTRRKFITRSTAAVAAVALSDGIKGYAQTGTLNIAITQTAVGASLGASAVGLSLEKNELYNLVATSSDPTENFFTSGSALVTLLQHLSGSYFRVGGGTIINSANQDLPTNVPLANLEQYFTVASAYGLKTIYGTAIPAGSTSDISSDETLVYSDLYNLEHAAIANYPTANISIELGNEPDNAGENHEGPGFNSQSGTAPCLHYTGMPSSAWQTALPGCVSYLGSSFSQGWKFVGPATSRPVSNGGSIAYFSSIAAAVTGAGQQVALYTGHYYFSVGSTCPTPPNQCNPNCVESYPVDTPANIMDPTVIDTWGGTTFPATPYQTAVEYMAAASGLASGGNVRFGECGSSNNSKYANSQAGSLRVLDLIFQAAYAGINGFNFHTNGGSGYSPVALGTNTMQSNGSALIFANFILTHAGGGASCQQLKATLSGSGWTNGSGTYAVNVALLGSAGVGSPNITAYAFKHSNGKFSLLICNKTQYSETCSGPSSIANTTRFYTMSPVATGDPTSATQISISDGNNFANTFTVGPYTAIWFYDINLS